MSFCFLPAALRAAQTAGITRSEADFEVFALPGRHVAPMGVKFGMKEWTLVHSFMPNPLLHAIFYRHRCNNKGIGPPNAKFLLRFYQKLAYPLRDFHKIRSVCRSFQFALAVKIWMDLLNVLRSYGGFKLRGSGSPNFSAPPIAAKLCGRLPKVLEVQERAGGPLSPYQV